MFLQAFGDEIEKLSAALNAPLAKAVRSVAPKTHLTPGSSNVQGYRYDASTKQMFVTFKGGKTYRYDDVSPAVYRSMKRSKSVGKAVNRRLKTGGHGYEKMAEDDVWAKIRKQTQERRDAMQRSVKARKSAEGEFRRSRAKRKSSPETPHITDKGKAAVKGVVGPAVKGMSQITPPAVAKRVFASKAKPGAKRKGRRGKRRSTYPYSKTLRTKATSSTKVGPTRTQSMLEMADAGIHSKTKPMPGVPLSQMTVDQWRKSKGQGPSKPTPSQGLAKARVKPTAASNIRSQAPLKLRTKSSLLGSKPSRGQFGGVQRGGPFGGVGGSGGNLGAASGKLKAPTVSKPRPKAIARAKAPGARTFQAYQRPSPMRKPGFPG